MLARSEAIGRGHKKASDQQIAAAYAEFRTVKAAGTALGMCGQSVHERLVKLGLCNTRNRFTAADQDRLHRDYESYANSGRLAALAAEMGRTKPYLATQARKLGLTHRDRSKAYLSDKISRRVTDWYRHNPHPRGMAGKVHTDEMKDAASQRSFERWHSMSKAAQIELGSSQKRSWKAGWREIGGKRSYYRSSWEANYARYLEWLRARGEVIGWEHEPETFWFEAIKRGTRSYLPDFKVTEKNGKVLYHEVKGWMDPASATKIRRMAKYHPHITLIVIDGKSYKSIKKTMAPLIPGWEASR